jgi:hypothetical protein
MRGRPKKPEAAVVASWYQDPMDGMRDAESGLVVLSNEIVAPEIRLARFSSVDKNLM